jgi:hypothetical protein
MTTHVETYASDQPLWSLTLTREDGDDEDDRAATDELLDAVDDLTRGWLVPLAVGFLVECCDPASFFEAAAPPAARSWFVRADAIASELRAAPAYADAKTVAVGAADVQSGVVRHWIEEARAQPCSASDLVVSLAELTWSVVRARLPVSGEVVVRDAAGADTSSIVVVHDDAWALGPVHGARTAGPVRLRAVNEHGSARIQLAVFWDVWIQHAAGRAIVEDGIARVLARARGWRVDDDTAR